MDHVRSTVCMYVFSKYIIRTYILGSVFLFPVFRYWKRGGEGGGGGPIHPTNPKNHKVRHTTKARLGGVEGVAAMA